MLLSTRVLREILIVVVRGASKARVCRPAAARPVLEVSRLIRSDSEFESAAHNPRPSREGIVLGWITCTKQYFCELPLRCPNFSKPDEKTQHDLITSLVRQ